jgi:protein TonB
MGIVEMPKFIQPLETVFIPESKPVEPETPLVKPEIADVMPLETPPPELQLDEPVVPPADNPMPASSNASAATAANGAPQELKTSQRVEPAYPATSRRQGEEGTVRVKVLVDERGRPQEVAVAQSSGFARLDEAALQAVRRWRFVAATNGERAVTAWTQVAITFRLTAQG